MKIILANNAGFCFGVNSALKIAYGLQNSGGGKVYTLGSLIHNEFVVNDLREKGIEVISSINDAPENSKVIIRAHGEKPETYEEAKRRNVEIIDATCPYVKKIHKLVSDKHQEGHVVVIAGDRNHPEVKGINGWCHGSALIADSPEDVDEFPQIDGTCCLVAQTTITRDKYERIYDKLKEKCKNIIKFDTICNATISRQEEAGEIARKADVMLVLGSRTSSNTRKLYEVSKKYCNETYLIETCDDLPSLDAEKINILGITAGASTPEHIIEEVIKKMEELNKKENEISFEEAFERSMVTLRNGDIVKGRIIGYNNTEVFIDLGYKSDGIIPVDEYTDDPDFKPGENIKIGEEIEVFVVKVNDGEGNVLLSKKKIDSMRGFDNLW
ncbi:MAG: 4-hydroxy-3-methylbut-2-enyl diphosphate reductase, partial [Bacillota bacterium]